MTPSAASTALFVDAPSDVSSVRSAGARMEDDVVAALTRRLVAGEEPAWREFHAAYFDRLLRYLRVVCRGDEHAARESLQTALVKIVRHVRRFDRAEAWWSWLAVVARSCVIDGARRQSRYRALIERYAGWLAVRVAPAPHDRSSELLEECLAALPPVERALLVSKYDERQSVAAIAVAAGCSEKAMESRLARLRQRVKSDLLQRLRDET